MTDPTVHASCVIVGTVGILLRGASGSGKSSLGDRLVEATRRRGHFAAWVSDDRTRLEQAGNVLIARPAAAIAGQLEVRGVGIMKTAFEPVASVDLILDLTPASEIPRLLDEQERSDTIENLVLPRFPIAEGQVDEALRRIRWILRGLFADQPDYF